MRGQPLEKPQDSSQLLLKLLVARDLKGGVGAEPTPVQNPPPLTSRRRGEIIFEDIEGSLQFPSDPA